MTLSFPMPTDVQDVEIREWEGSQLLASWEIMSSVRLIMQKLADNQHLVRKFIL